MTLEVDFNDPRILQGYVEQFRQQLGLNEGNRLVVGSQGGLAYALFTGDNSDYPQNFPAGTFCNLSCIKRYVNSVKDYLDRACSLSENFGFELVREDSERKIVEFTIGDFVYGAGIGSPTIEGANRLERFVKMIKEGRSELDLMLTDIKIARKAFTTKAI